MTVVRAPATTANLGAGFDALGLAVGRSFELGLDAAASDADVAAPEHPAARAFAAAGGSGPIAVRSDFPPGRGLGFSGAARVAAVIAAAVQRGEDWANHKAELLAVAVDLEGHADNAAAAMFGGLVVTAGERSVQVPAAPGFEPQVLAWIPDRETSTKRSRTSLPTSVSLEDAVFNLGRAAMFVAAWSSGTAAAFSNATEDRWHQSQRLIEVPDSAAVLTALRARGVPAWLSGSGPTVAALVVDAAAAAECRAALETTSGGRTEVLPIDHVGASVDFDRSHRSWS